MPKINDPTPADVCYYCGNTAHYISVNTKIKRCTEKINQCRGFIITANVGRIRHWQELGGGEMLRLHMKSLSSKGNQILTELHKNSDWVKQKSEKIKQQIINRGGVTGENNPHFGKKHTEVTKNIMRQKALLRDNTQFGKYERTTLHRRVLSERLTQLIQMGKLTKLSNTKPELIMKSIFEDMNIDYTHQFLIQYGSLGKSDDWFRHLYDFRINDTNIIIEVDGDYWHSLPNIRARDKKCEAVAIQRNFVVYRFTEHQLKHDRLSVMGALAEILK